MTLPTDLVKRHQVPAFFGVTFMSRLGGIAGLLGVGLAVAQVLRLAAPVPALDKILQILPNLAALYPICKAYEAFKHCTLASSVWRMI